MAKKSGSGLGKDALFGTPAESPPPKSKARDRTKPDALRRRTFMLSNEMFERIQSVAEQYGVGQNELVRHLLEWSMDQVENGTHELPVKTRNTLE